VAGEIFGDRVHDYVHAQLEWKLKERGGPSIVTGHHGAGFFGQADDGAEIGDVEQRVGWRFCPDEARGRRDGAFQGSKVLHVDQRMLESPLAITVRNRMGVP